MCEALKGNPGHVVFFERPQDRLQGRLLKLEARTPARTREVVLLLDERTPARTPASTPEEVVLLKASALQLLLIFAKVKILLCSFQN